MIRKRGLCVTILIFSGYFWEPHMSIAIAKQIGAVHNLEYGMVMENVRRNLSWVSLLSRVLPHPGLSKEHHY